MTDQLATMWPPALDIAFRGRNRFGNGPDCGITTEKEGKRP